MDYLQRTKKGAPGWPTTVLWEACELLGISRAGAKLLRIGQCATIALPAAGLVARVARPECLPETLEAELYFARVAHKAGLPVAAPADEVANAPILTPDGPVTFWPLLRPETSGELDWGWLGRTLRRLHQLPVPPSLPSLWDPLKRVEQRIAAYAAQPYARSDYVSVLSNVCVEACKELLQVRSALGVGLVHGDATPSNVIQTKQGPLLIDFDLAGVGPLEWDLMAAVVIHRRFGLPFEHLRCFLKAYSFDPIESESFRLLRKVRELLDTSFALTLSGIDARAERELNVRMRVWLSPDDRSVWTPLGTTLISVLKS